MTTQKERDQRIRDGKHAQRLLKDRMLNRVLQEMRQTLYNDIVSSDTDQASFREGRYHLLRAVDLFEDKLVMIIKRGDLAQHREDQGV